MKEPRMVLEDRWRKVETSVILILLLLPQEVIGFYELLVEGARVVYLVEI